MPVCDSCGEPFAGTEVFDDAQAVERLYRGVADGQSRLETLQMIYDMFSTLYDLRPPELEIRIAERCLTRASNG